MDLRHNFDAGVQRLANQLSTVPDIDFSRLDSQTFEHMVADLLVELGFSVQQAPLAHDSGFNFIASYRSRDPFGAGKTETWLVEMKFYPKQRVSVSALGRMFGFLVTSTVVDKGLVVTNGSMTSVAAEFLADLMSKSGRVLRVIDRTELAGLLMQHPAIVRRYLARAEER